MPRRAARRYDVDDRRNQATIPFYLRLTTHERAVLKKEANRHALNETAYLRRLILGAHASKFVVPMVLEDFYLKR